MSPNDPTGTRAPAEAIATNSNATNSVADPAAATGDPSVPILTDALPLRSTGRYALSDEIARGGMGVVYRATDIEFGREVAVKVLQERFTPSSGAVRRFADEARITGQLQHPAIPPIHDLGTLPDGRPFLAMKFIKGDTLDDLLQQRPHPTHERGRFVAVFEQVCQALAFAHAHKVIHRDLKPANVMVGNFGEVQVMDWGLAKVLGARVAPSADPDETSSGTQIHSLRESDGEFTQAGSVLGTPAFMPPEQAVGAIGKVDTRSDVFGLGAILAVILTGQPPFASSSAETTRVKAAQGQVDECFARLDTCGADPELVALCKRCLAAKQENRPADAGEVARAVAELRAAADDRARQAELDRVKAEGERATAEARADEEAKTRRVAEEKATEQRKRRRVQLLLACAVGLLVVAGGAFGWYSDRKGTAERERLSRDAEAVSSLLDQAESALRAGDAAKAAVTLEVAQKRAAEGGTDELTARLEKLQVDLRALRDLDAIDRFRWTPVEGKWPDSAMATERYREALGRFGVTPESVSVDEAVVRVSESAVRERLVAALDRWLRAERLAWVRAVLRGADPDPYRDAFRDAVLAEDKAKVAALAGRPEAMEQPTGFVAVLGDDGAIPPERRRELLAVAVRHRPGDLSLLMSLGITARVARFGATDEQLRWFQAAVAIAPGNSGAHSSLGSALYSKGDWDGTIAEFKEALRLDPKGARSHNTLGWALQLKGDLDGAIAEYEESLRLDPNYDIAKSNLWNALKDKETLKTALAEYKAGLRLNPNNAAIHRARGRHLYNNRDWDGAMSEFKEALRLIPTFANAHIGLGDVLYVKGDLVGAIGEYREALRSDSKHFSAHFGLGNALRAKGDLDEAIVAYKEVLRLEPKYTFIHLNLGNALLAKGDLGGAITEYKEELRLAPRSAAGHIGLGNVLSAKGDRDGAIAEFQEAIRLEPQSASARLVLGNVLKDKKDLVGAEAAYREALKINPKYAPAHCGLGNVLRGKKDQVGAEAAYRETLKIDPKYVLAHHGLGNVLMDKGDIDGVVAECKEILRIDPKYSYALEKLPWAERTQQLLHRLPAVLAGMDEPKTPAEAIDFAYLCQQPYQSRFLSAVGLYEKAFADPKLAVGLVAGHRYYAACSAAQAARGGGVDAPADPAVRAALRAKALAWLRADLSLWTKRAASSSAPGRQAAVAKMAHWLGDSDLAHVRGVFRLAALPADEAKEWLAFWAEVRATRAEALKPPPPPEVAPPPRLLDRR